MKDTVQHKRSIEGQHDYEEWKAELLSDPEDRAAYEAGVERILRQQGAVAARSGNKAKRVNGSARTAFSSSTRSKGILSHLLRARRAIRSSLSDPSRPKNGVGMKPPR